MMEPWCEGLKELGLLFLQKGTLKKDGLKAYKVSEAVSKYCSPNPAPSGWGTW